MGLDSVSLILAFEEAFQISIPDHEAEKLRTPRDVIDCISARLEVKVQGPGVIYTQGGDAITLLTLSPEIRQALTREDICID